MRSKDVKILVAVLCRQAKECERLSTKADQEGDVKGHAFQEGARIALRRAIEYVQDAQAGILTE